MRNYHDADPLNRNRSSRAARLVKPLGVCVALLTVGPLVAGTASAAVSPKTETTHSVGGDLNQFSSDLTKAFLGKKAIITHNGFNTTAVVNESVKGFKPTGYVFKKIDASNSSGAHVVESFSISVYDSRVNNSGQPTGTSASSHPVYHYEITDKSILKQGSNIAGDKSLASDVSLSISGMIAHPFEAVEADGQALLVADGPKLNKYLVPVANGFELVKPQATS